MSDQIDKDALIDALREALRFKDAVIAAKDERIADLLKDAVIAAKDERIADLLKDKEAHRLQIDSLLAAQMGQLDILKELHDKINSRTVKLELWKDSNGYWLPQPFEIKDYNGVMRKLEFKLWWDGGLRLFNKGDKKIIVDATFHLLGKTCTLDAERIEAGGHSKCMKLMSDKEMTRDMKSVNVRIDIAIHTSD